MKRTIWGMLLIVLLAVPLSAEVLFKSVSATTTSKTIPLGSRYVQVINDGSDTIYVRVFSIAEAPGAATTSNGPIYNGEGFTFEPGGGVGSISILSAGNSTVRLFYE